jgi:hypothetical protein
MLRHAAAVAVLVPTLARAEPGPEIAAGLDYSVGHGGHVEALDLGMRLEAGLFLRVNRWHATFSFPVHPHIRSSRPVRDTDDLTGFGLSGRLAYRAPLFGGVLAIGGGITRRWIWAKEEIMKSCMQTGDCIAGTYLDKPMYHAWAPQLRIGIGPDKQWPRMVMGASFEIIVEAIGLNDVKPEGIREVTVMGAVTLTIGGGPRR